jgi:hypothetical protein
MTDNGWRAQAAGEGALQSPLSVASYSAYSSDGDAGGANGLGATGSRSSAMRELRERIQRERQQLHELERQLSHRKPIATTIRPSPAPGSVGTLRISPSSPQARSSKSSPDASNEKDAFRSGGGGMQRGSDKLHTPGGAPAPGQSPVRRPGRSIVRRTCLCVSVWIIFPFSPLPACVARTWHAHDWVLFACAGKCKKTCFRRGRSPCSPAASPRCRIR